MRFEGFIKTWNDDRGFGFIEPTQSGQAIFVHIKAFRQLSGRPQEGQAVSFAVELGPQGQKRAKDVEPIRASRTTQRIPNRAPARQGTATLFAIPAFLILYLVASVVWNPPPLLGLVYIAASVFTFFAYALDKSAAKRGAWRTPESTLHFLALAGGWPGALLAQQLFRHKSSKAEFRSVFWATVLINVVVFLAWCSPAWRLSWPAR